MLLALRLLYESPKRGGAVYGHHWGQNPERFIDVEANLTGAQISFAAGQIYASVHAEAILPGIDMTFAGANPRGQGSATARIEGAEMQFSNRAIPSSVTLGATDEPANDDAEAMALIQKFL